MYASDISGSYGEHMATLHHTPFADLLQLGAGAEWGRGRRGY